jgi:hypothetical protein
MLDNVPVNIVSELRGMFGEVNESYERHRGQRINFLSFSYVIHKLLQLRDYEQYLQYFPLSKSKGALYQHDKIWKNICDDLGYEFHDSSKEV